LAPLIAFTTPHSIEHCGKSNMKLKIASALVTSLFAGVLVSTSASAADLLDVYRDALAQDPVYASARAALEAGREVIPQARAGVVRVVTAETPEALITTAIR
jgi:hypothetical protein